MKNALTKIMAAASIASLSLLALPRQASAEPPSANATSCDRQCLYGFVDQYLAAVVAHDPSKIEKAVHVKFTEDGQELELGDGFWGTASAIGAYKHYFADPESGNAGFFGTMRENGNPVLFAARIKVVDRKISEIETIVPRYSTGPQSTGITNLEKMKKPEAIWEQDIPKSQRMSRWDLMKAANKYFTGMEGDNPKGDYSFFADDCNRLEDGTQTTNNPTLSMGNSNASSGLNYAALGCRAQFQSGMLQAVTRIRDRRFLIVDPQKGVVVAFGFFDHAAQLKEITLGNGKTIKSGLKQPITWELAEAFKITKGKIRRVEAVLKQSPYGMPPGWSEDDLGYSSRLGPR